MAIQETRRLEERDVDAFLDHMERLVHENGRGASPIFMGTTPQTFTRQPEARRVRWSASPPAPAWTRTWGSWAEGRIVGNVQLDGRGSPAEAHRVWISLALEAAYRGQGLGTALMELGLREAAAMGFTWADLVVYASNPAALRLYEKLGFVRTGLVPDLARVHGRSVDGIGMSLRLPGAR
jgi:ribosomal protein S18 acetylase RimI-like enzyme